MHYRPVLRIRVPNAVVEREESTFQDRPDLGISLPVDPSHHDPIFIAPSLYGIVQ
jgi:hypothetical protein